MSNEKIEEVYYEVMLVIEKLLKDNHDPLSIAGVMTSQALSLYKAELTDKGYDRIIESIVDKKDDVDAYEVRVLH